ncbi:MAG TPA: hypothetical protein VHE35_09650 [Kofleriaceae bacterium]|nr:hypothetical protein [Kofleriaceae bacterium]
MKRRQAVRDRVPRRLVLALAPAVALAGAAGCKSKPAPTTPSNTASDEVAKVDPTLCDTAGKNVVSYDLNHDSRPDVWKMYKRDDSSGTVLEVLTCKQVDFDHDGRKDWVVGYTPKGTEAFEKADFDYDGKFDMSTVYDPKTGKKVEVERDSDFDGQYDIKEVYDRFGELNSVRRDRNGDGQPDYWEQYKDGTLIAILYDDDFDNKVDRKEEVPGMRPKFVAPEPGRGPAEGVIPSGTAPAGSTTTTGPGAAPGAGSGSGAATTPAGTKPAATTPAGTKPAATTPAGTKPAATTPPAGGT